MAATRIGFGFIVMVILGLIFLLSIIAAIVVAIVLLVRWSNRQAAVPQPVSEPPKRPLAEILKEHRTRCGMTQEYVAEALGISRQAVSKWESGLSEPASANLTALAELYGVPVDELMRSK